jgi:hypothetical protein
MCHKTYSELISPALSCHHHHGPTADRLNTPTFVGSLSPSSEIQKYMYHHRIIQIYLSKLLLQLKSTGSTSSIVPSMAN